jgi:predicted RNase H-like nuclease (RuvC/YqgF family)
MMDFEFKDVILPSIFSALSGFFGWIVGRKKEHVEVQKTEIENVSDAIKLWRETALELKAEVAELKTKVETLTTEIHGLRTENIELRAKLNENHKDQ